MSVEEFFNRMHAKSNGKFTTSGTGGGHYKGRGNSVKSPGTGQSGKAGAVHRASPEPFGIPKPHHTTETSAQKGHAKGDVGYAEFQNRKKSQTKFQTKSPAVKAAHATLTGGVKVNNAAKQAYRAAVERMNKRPTPAAKEALLKAQKALYPESRG